MTTTATSQKSLAELVSENPARAAVFDRVGLDFCCHGNRSLPEACAAAGLDMEDVTTALEAVADDIPEGWTGGGRGDLAEHIRSIHHSYLHDELEPLGTLADKVYSVHGSRHPELEEVARLVGEIVSDFLPHLSVEEMEVFPAISALAAGTAGGTELAGRIDALVAEHTALGEKLARLHEVTDAYSVPDDGCASYEWLYQRLAHLESDTHIHVHLENNILFPAALVEAI